MADDPDRAAVRGIQRVARHIAKEACPSSPKLDSLHASDFGRYQAFGRTAHGVLSPMNSAHRRALPALMVIGAPVLVGASALGVSFDLASVNRSKCANPKMEQSQFVAKIPRSA